MERWGQRGSATPANRYMEMALYLRATRQVSLANYGSECQPGSHVIMLRDVAFHSPDHFWAVVKPGCSDAFYSACSDCDNPAACGAGRRSRTHAKRKHYLSSSPV